MKVKAKRVEGGFLIPLIEELKDKDEIVVEIEEPSTDFLGFLKKIYKGKENVSELEDEEALRGALKEKYDL